VGQLAYGGHADSAIVIWRLFQALAQRDRWSTGLPSVGYSIGLLVMWASLLLSIRRPNDQQAGQLTNRSTPGEQKNDSEVAFAVGRLGRQCPVPFTLIPLSEIFWLQFHISGFALGRELCHEREVAHHRAPGAQLARVQPALLAPHHHHHPPALEAD
jgi:hypothetical protein